MRKLGLAMLTVLAMIVAFALPASAQDDARIHLIHGIPGVDVDVEAGGETVFEGFSFRDTQDLSALAGETLAGLQVKVAGTDDVAIDAGDVALPASGNYTVIAHLDADGTPTLGVFENDTSTIEAGNGRLIVRHTAAAPAVDVKANGDVAFSNLPNGDEAKADLPAGTISAEVVPTGEDEPVVVGPADLPITEGEALIVYAVGSLDDGVEVITESIDGLGSTPSEVPTGDSPVEAAGSSLPVGLTLMVLGGLALGAGGAVATRRVKA